MRRRHDRNNLCGGLHQFFRLAAVDDLATVNGQTIIPVVSNDELDGCGPVTITIMSEPQYGSLYVNNPTGSVVFTPDECYDGPDSFEYRLESASCARVSNTATVDVTIVAPEILVTCNGVFLTCGGNCLYQDC